jgi:hypothetical protein
MKADLLWRQQPDILPFSARWDSARWDMDQYMERDVGRRISPYADPPRLPRRPQLPPELERQIEPNDVVCIRCGMTVSGGFTYNGLCAPCEVVRFKKLSGAPQPQRAKPVEIPTPSPAKPEVQPSPLGSKGKRVFSDD